MKCHDLLGYDLGLQCYVGYPEVLAQQGLKSYQNLGPRFGPGEGNARRQRGLPGVQTPAMEVVNRSDLFGPCYCMSHQRQRDSFRHGIEKGMRGRALKPEGRHENQAADQHRQDRSVG